MAHQLEVVLIVEVDEGEAPFWTATVPAFHLPRGRFNVVAQGETAGAALRQLHEQLAEVSATERVEPPIQAEPMERMETFGIQTAPSQDAPDA